MKRKRYTIEGDLLDRFSGSSGPRYMVSDAAICGPTTLTESLFTLLPIEVTCLIVSTIAHENDAIDLQSFLSYLLPLHGVSLAKHQAHYNVIQTTLLYASQNAVKEEMVDLFSQCFDERLGRISSTSRRFDVKSTHTTTMASLQAIVNAPFIELFTFVNSTICEHCLNDLAITRYWERVHLPEIQADDDLVPLCSDCGCEMQFDYRIKESTKKIDYAELRKTPHKRYRWMSEKKCRQWCGVDVNAIPTTIRKKSSLDKRSPGTLYLLKDALPFIKERYFVNHKKGEPLNFSDSSSCDDGAA